MRNIFLLLLCATVSATAAYSQRTAGTGGTTEVPVHLIIRYQAEKNREPQFRNELTTHSRKRLEEWKRQGMFRSYRIFSSSTFSESSWDGMLILTFNRFADVGNWMRIEQSYPGGLDSTALSFGHPVASDIWDLPFSGGPIDQPESSGKESIFLVKPYGYDQRAIYMLYATAYVTLQFNTWLSSGTLRSYGIYLNREPTGPAWDILMVLEYQDIKTLADREAVKTGVGTELQKSPAWDLLNRMKLSIRGSNEERLIARQIAP